VSGPTIPLLLQEHERLLADERSLLDRIVALARAVDDRGADHEVAQTLRRHVDERFLLVVVGEVKAGKSTFVNVLLGREVCAVGPTPVTDRIAVLQFGAKEGERVVEEYLVEHDLPLELLRDVSIVDTPGTNSVLREHSALTERFIPRADLVLFLTSIDRPYSDSERRFLELIAERWRKKVVFLLTKIDGRDAADVKTVVDWLKKQCVAHHGFEPEVLPISARLAQRGEGDGGLGSVRDFVRATLAEGEKMRLKLESPLRSVDAVLRSLGAALERESRILDDDFRAVRDLERQVDQAASELKERTYRPLAEVEELFNGCGERAREFFERHGGVKALAFGKGEPSLRDAFEKEVVAPLDSKYREVVGHAIDWIVKEEIALHERCTAFLRDQVKPLAAGRALPGEAARFDYRREEVFRSILTGYERDAATLDVAGEPRRFLEAAERGVKQQLVVTFGAIGVGASSLALMKTLSAIWLTAGLLVAAGLGLGGLAILPAVRRRALKKFMEKLAALRGQVRAAFTRATAEEIDATRDRLRRAWEPFLLFHRSEASQLAERLREQKELRRLVQEIAQRVEWATEHDASKRSNGSE
jgi:small GTP-binding protein